MAGGVPGVGQGLVEVGAPGHERGGERPPDHGRRLVQVDVPEAALELPLEALAPEHRPGFLQVDVPHALEDGVGDLRAAVREPLARPLGRQGHDFLPRGRDALRGDERGDEERAPDGDGRDGSHGLFSWSDGPIVCAYGRHSATPASPIGQGRPRSSWTFSAPRRSTRGRSAGAGEPSARRRQRASGCANVSGERAGAAERTIRPSSSRSSVPGG